MRAAMACTLAGAVAGDRADLARRQLRDRLLSAASGGHQVDGRDNRALARLSAGFFRTAASELANDALAARQPLVRSRDLAGAARPGRRHAHSEASIRSMSSSLKPK